MDKQVWTEQIPFYLNGTLNEHDRQAFEHALRDNPAWQREIDEWRTLADAVYRDAAAHSKRLPPISAQLREAIAGGQSAQMPPPNYNNGTGAGAGTQQLIPLPPRQSTGATMPPRSAGRGNRRVTNAVGAMVTIAAAVAVLIAAGILLMTVTEPDAELTPDAVAALGTEAETETEAFGAPQSQSTPTRFALPVTTATLTPIPPTAIVPPTDPQQAPFVPPTNTIVPGVGGGGGDGTGEAGSAQLAPQNPIGSGGGGNIPEAEVFTTPEPPIESEALQQQSVPNPAIAARGNCYVERPLGTTPIPIFRFADVNSDVIGTMQTGQQLDTWVNSPQGDSVFYQVFLPTSSIRLGWVDGALVDVYGPDGSAGCTNITQPTPTNPAFPGNLPTPFPDGDTTCRVSSATGSSVPVYRIPSTSTSIVGSLSLGDLYVAREFYTGQPGWYRVIVPGVGFGYLQGSSVNTNGTCNALPQSSTYEEPTVAPSSTTTPLIPTITVPPCRVVGVVGSSVALRGSPSQLGDVIGTLTSDDVAERQFDVARQTTDGLWYDVYTFENGVVQMGGWVLAGDILLDGDCANTIVINATSVAQTQQPPASRTPLPSPTAETLNP